MPLWPSGMALPWYTSYKEVKVPSSSLGRGFTGACRLKGLDLFCRQGLLFSILQHSKTLIVALLVIIDA